MEVKKTVYIAGPMRGMPHNNRTAFCDAAARLRDKGFYVYNPAELGDWFLELRRRTEADLDKDPSLLEDLMHFEKGFIWECDIIYLLKGWERSAGAKSELATAIKFGLEIAME